MESQTQIKGFGYARKSPDDKEDTKTSIDNQITLIQSTFQKNGWELIKIFIDSNVSGGDRKRKEFINMMQELYMSNHISLVVVKDQDRFCRDTSFFMDTLRMMSVRKKKLYSCLQNKFLSDDDLGDGVKALIDGDYIKQQRKRAELLLQQKKDAGKVMFRPVFGYKVNYKFNAKGLKVPINKDKEINDWIISSRESQIVLGVVQDYLNSLSCGDSTQKYGIVKAKYYRIIRNACNGLYSGFVHYSKKGVDPNGEVANVEEITYPANHEKIIPDDIYSKLKDRSA